MVRTPPRRRDRVWTVIAIAGMPLLAAGLIVASALGAFSGIRSLAPLSSPPVVADYDQEQRDNAATIMRAARDLGLSVRDQAIGIMTAMGESSLRNIDHGDGETSGVTNPDGTPTTSIGLFQQQDGWGSRAERLDPYISATLFYRAMIMRAPDRDTLAPTLVAHRTQINQDPDHYARYWPRAVALIEALSGEESGLDP
ncbi:peptidase M23 [Microbacterium lacticum]|uniref:Transglycosylase-like protein with SLT domain n=1 Tax=Microbacterium lacticum TaxID=33885 RepID=A0A4Y3ULA1_9MICO|nr:peptidase M23 [Microbacterium lacticum]TQM91315.1 hypothetical protein FHX68_2527 [Microbacterium lacticum]GEB95741.1 hypothetical protein MLA01_19600 [Microbacterium lacticum]GGN16641.1 hypothetical protein GCM10009724_08020 [Microbacterium lacticum]